MVSIHREGNTKKVKPPLLQGTYDREELLLVDGVVELCARELGRLESNWVGSLECFTVRGRGTGAPVARVSRYEDAVVTHVGMVN